MDYSKTTDDFQQEKVWTGTIVPDVSSKTYTSAKEQKQAISKKETESIASVLERVEHLYDDSQILEDAVNISSKRNYGYLKEDSLKDEINLSDGSLFQISEYLSRIDLIVNKAIRYLEGL